MIYADPESNVMKAERNAPSRARSEIPVYGEQEQSAYNGHFESTCYHPLLMFNGEGDCLAAEGPGADSQDGVICISPRKGIVGLSG